MALESTQPLTEISTRNIAGVKRRPERKADNLTAICENVGASTSHNPMALQRPVTGRVLSLTILRVWLQTYILIGYVVQAFKFYPAMLETACTTVQQAPACGHIFAPNLLRCSWKHWLLLRMTSSCFVRVQQRTALRCHGIVYLPW
jgi:hypothetical protein